ncbi:MAG: hypothetical protein NWE93_05160 [Candidatus Bathyarchaeota archaeon]|nr:hypothetical protein [Candidatus Bathyarchaeota archaeon]
MPAYSQIKIERLKRKVSPYLQKAKDLYESGHFEAAEREIRHAKKELSKENAAPPILMIHIAKLLNNIGNGYTQSEKFEESFNCLSKAFELMLTYKASTQNIRLTFSNLINPALFCCEFDYLKDKIKYLSEIPMPKEFKDLLLRTSKSIKNLENNEPDVKITPPECCGSQSTKRLCDYIYMPNALERVPVQLGIDLSLFDHQTLSCSISIEPDKGVKISDVYKTDSWKKFGLSEAKQKKQFTPNLVLFLSENGHIPMNSIKVKNQFGQSVDFDFKEVFAEVTIPSSYPRFGGTFGRKRRIPKLKSFKYFRGKAGIIEWELKSEPYCVELKVKNLEKVKSPSCTFSIALGFLTPFKTVNLRNSSLNISEKLKLTACSQKRIPYFNDQKEPGAFFSVSLPISLSAKQFVEGWVPKKISGTSKFEITNPSETIYPDYSIFGLLLNYIIIPGNKSISITEWEQPIPTGLAHFIMDKQFGFPPLCAYTIANNSEKEIITEMTTEIEGFSNRQEDIKQVLPYSIGNINHTPLLNKNAMKLRDTSPASLKAAVSINGNIALKNTFQVQMLAPETMIWEILNPFTQEVYNLHDFIAAWVTPHCMEVEKLVARAKEKHPQKQLFGYSGNSLQAVGNLYSQCEAIFLAVKETGITYVNASNCFGWNEPYAYQRVKLPTTTLISRSADCIDGTVLFASLLEHVGIQPIIILLPNHALVGWKKVKDSMDFEFLETTVIPSCDFKNAIEAAKKRIEATLDYFRETHQPIRPNLTFNEAVEMLYIRIIDVAKMREKKVFPRS